MTAWIAIPAAIVAFVVFHVCITPIWREFFRPPIHGPKRRRRRR